MPQLTWENAFNNKDTIDKYFDGNSEAWLEYMLNEHQLSWVDDFINVIKDFYTDEPNVEKDIRWIIGMMNYQTKEFDTKGGDVTCEFITKDIYKPVVELLMIKFKMQLGYWQCYIGEVKQTTQLFVEIEAF